VLLKGQASELAQVLALELHRQVAMALLVQATPLEVVPAGVAAQVAAAMAGSLAVEAPDRDLVAVDTLKFPFQTS
jgi:hypothetical protein